MFVIAETLRVVRAVLGYAVRGRRFGLLVMIVGALIALLIAGSVTVAVPVVFYPLL